MMLLVRALLSVGIVLVSLVLGVVSGALMVRYVFPPPALLPGGMREGTPVQIIAFFGTFLFVAIVAGTIGIRLLVATRRRGVPKANEPTN